MANKPEVIQKRKQAAENWAVRSRNYRRARERALTALARKYKEDYLELLEQEKAKDEQAGKRWHSLADSVPGNRLVRTDTTGNKDRGDTSDLSQNESNNK